MLLTIFLLTTTLVGTQQQLKIQIGLKLSK